MRRGREGYWKGEGRGESWLEGRQWKCVNIDRRVRREEGKGGEWNGMME
jgi:hypothetical protein